MIPVEKGLILASSDSVAIDAVAAKIMGFDWIYINPIHYPGFSGSLYALALSGRSVLGAITPFGGVAFIAAWLCLAWGLFSAR